MTASRFRSRWAMAAVTLALLAGAGAAQARSDVYWSVGVGVPGVVVGASNGPSYSYYPPPVYYTPPPPVYYAPPVYRAPAPVYYAPPPVYYAPRPHHYRPPVHHGRGNHHGGGHRNWR